MRKRKTPKKKATPIFSEGTSQSSVQFISKKKRYEDDEDFVPMKLKPKEKKQSTLFGTRHIDLNDNKKRIVSNLAGPKTNVRIGIPNKNPG